jgi:hypothetical protein
MLLVVLIVLALVAISLDVRPEESKLYRLRYFGNVAEADYLKAFLLLTVALSISTFPVLPRKAVQARTRPHIFDPTLARPLLALALVGATMTVAGGGADTLAARGTATGQGLQNLLYWSVAVFIAYCVVLASFRRHRSYVLIASLLAAVLATSGNRSPLALIAVALLVRVALSGRTAFIAGGLLLSPVALFVFSYQSIWRGLSAAGLPSDPSDVLSYIRADPLTQFLRTGFDSIDGNVLTMNLLSRGAEARWFDPFSAILNFVPRAIWPGKPGLLGSDIGSEYLGLSAGGIFLSGPGYFFLVAGSATLGLALFVAFILALKTLLASPSLHPVISVAVLYLIVRFPLAGDSIDIFFAVQICLILAIASITGKILPWRM